MKYAVLAPADQTILYWADASGNTETGKHPEAYLFADRASAEAAVAPREQSVREHWKTNGWTWRGGDWHVIEEVLDEAEFRSREDTWSETI